MYNFSDRCNNVIDCTDASDELGCQCEEDEYTCECITKRTCIKPVGCISQEAIRDGFIYCPSGDNTRQYEKIPIGSFGRINIYRLDNKSECDSIGFPQCDVSSCFVENLSNCYGSDCSTSNVICTSYCADEQNCKHAFQCNDRRLIFSSQFCDGIVDCADGSDEVTNQRGFKCNRCILPQNNLYDNVLHCNGNSDLCLVESDSCFQCLDKRFYISSNQVCDGVNDCFDFSDECLCEEYFYNEMCLRVFRQDACLKNNVDIINIINILNLYVTQNSINSPTTKVCRTKFAFVQATLCDGVPECKDFSDECECSSPPTFCNNSCHSYFLMGDRYCDGTEDPAWKYINDSACPKGFDEQDCSKRFKCNAKGKVSIDITEVCDGKSDCDDSSDEIYCSSSHNPSIFSSETELIASPTIKIVFWMTAFAVILGNGFAITRSIKILSKDEESPNRNKSPNYGEDSNKSQHNTTKFSTQNVNQTLNPNPNVNFNENSDEQSSPNPSLATDEITKFKRVLLLNISIADIIMGFYLLTVASYSATYSGIYGQFDHEWRSSLNCSITGSLAVFSSETSCFLMVILTAFKLKSSKQKSNSESSITKLWPWVLCIVAVWLFGFLLSIFPIFGISFQYFTHTVSFPSTFHKEGTWVLATLKQFACRYEVLSNLTITDYGDDFESVSMFLENTFPDSSPVRSFGYYGETSVCMPRLYVGRGERSWEFTLFLITLNLLCFLFIAVGNILIQWQDAKLTIDTTDRAKKIRKLFFALFGTDFCCWIPICILSYSRLFGPTVPYPDIVYQISATLLLPINSAVNPLVISYINSGPIN